MVSILNHFGVKEYLSHPCHSILIRFSSVITIHQDLFLINAYLCPPLSLSLPPMQIEKRKKNQNFTFNFSFPNPGL